MGLSTYMVCSEGASKPVSLASACDSLSGGPAGPLASAHDGLVASAVAEAVIASMRVGGAWTPVTTPEY